MTETRTKTTWVLQARLTEAEQGQWEELWGFAYPTRSELQAVYDEHFAAIDGQGCAYRFACVTVTQAWEYAEPTRAGTGEKDAPPAEVPG